MQVSGDDAWQDEAAHFLIGCGFRPTDTVGQVEHVANMGRTGRTFGSVWHAMRRLVDRECAHTGQAIDADLRGVPPANSQAMQTAV